MKRNSRQSEIQNRFKLKPFRNPEMAKTARKKNKSGEADLSEAKPKLQNRFNFKTPELKFAKKLKLA